MAHVLIVGRTESGKSALLKQLGSHLRVRGEECLAFNPIGGRGFTKRDEFGCAGAEYETDDAEEFAGEVSRRLIAQPKRRYLLIDEAHEFFERAGGENNWMGTKGRHSGLNLIMATQRGALISPTIRSQCGALYLFPCSLTDAKFLSDEYGCKELADAPSLPMGTYYHYRKNSLTKGRVF